LSGPNPISPLKEFLPADLYLIVQNCHTAVESYLRASEASPDKFNKNSLGLMFEGYVKDGSKLSVNGAAANIWFLTIAGSS
jgi:hypothetical protein